jgi:hypothetical protein
MNKILLLTVLGCVASFALTRSANADWYGETLVVESVDEAGSQSVNGGQKNKNTGGTTASMGSVKSWAKFGTPEYTTSPQSSRQTSALYARRDYTPNPSNTLTTGQVYCYASASLEASHNTVAIMNQAQAASGVNVLDGVYTPVNSPNSHSISDANLSVNSNNGTAGSGSGFITLAQNGNHTFIRIKLYASASGSRWRPIGSSSYEASSEVTFSLGNLAN